jgi:hypothetical protein
MQTQIEYAGNVNIGTSKNQIIFVYLSKIGEEGVIII